MALLRWPAQFWKFRSEINLVVEPHMCKLTESLPYLFIHVSQVMVTFIFFRIALSVISLQQNERKERGTLSICWSMHDNIKLGPKSHPNTKKLAGHSQPCGYSSTRQMLRISFFWPDWNSYVRLGVFHTIFSTKRSHSFFPPQTCLKFFDDQILNICRVLYVTAP